MITDEDISRVVSGNAFDAGLEYHLHGRVAAVQVASDGSEIEAVVEGNGRVPYRQNIRIIQQGGQKPQIFGSCTCPVGANCKHVAAALFSFQDDPQGTDLLAALEINKTSSTQAASHFLQPAAIAVSQQSTPAEEPLPPEVQAWLRNIEAAHEIDSEEYPANVRKRLLYVLDRVALTGSALLNLYAMEVKRDGGIIWSNKRYDPRQITNPGQQPKFLRPSDRRILNRLVRFGGETDEEFIDTLRAIIGTERGRWRSFDGPRLTEGDCVEGRLVWTLSDDGRQRPELELPKNGMSIRQPALSDLSRPGFRRESCARCWPALPYKRKQLLGFGRKWVGVCPIRGFRRQNRLHRRKCCVPRSSPNCVFSPAGFLSSPRTLCHRDDLGPGARRH